MLLADDSVTTHRVMELTFAGQGIRVTAVTDGEQAVAWMNATRPDIVVAEVALPRVDGFSLSEHVRRTPGLSDVPVLLMTGTFDVVDEARVRACGAAGIIVRPFEPEAVIKRVKDLLGISPKAEPVSTRLVTALDAPSEPDSTDARVPETPVAEKGAAEGAEQQSPSGSSTAANTGASNAEMASEAQAVQPLPETKVEQAPAKPADRSGDDQAPADPVLADLERQLAEAASSGPVPGSDTPSPSSAAPTTNADAPIFEIDEELFGGALEAQRQKLSTITQVARESGPAPGQSPVVAAADSQTDITRHAAPPVVPSAAPRVQVAAESREPGPGASFGAPLPDVPVVAESFQSLLTVVQETSTQAVPHAAAIPDEVVERIAQRVAERLSEGLFVDTVRRVVEEVAERLVREEIARIRARVEERSR
jgi:two-component system chemotaxis response regulator CheY